jgi:hypothetical protein
MQCYSAYIVSNTIRESSLLQDSPIYQKLETLLLRYDGIRALIRSIPGRKSRSYDDILSLVTVSTLRWGKPYECVRVKDFVDGKIHSASSGADCSHRTIMRGLHQLCDDGLLCKFTAREGRDCFYALNIDEIVRRLKSYIDSLALNAQPAKIAKKLYNEIIESPDFIQIADLIRRFSGKVISDIQNLQRILEETRQIVVDAISEVHERISDTVNISAERVADVVNSLSEKSRKIVLNTSETMMTKAITAIHAAKNRAREISDRKTSSIAGRQIVTDSYIDAAAAVALWHREVRDADCFSGYQKKTTSKITGMMRHWLKECVEQGLNEQDIRANVRRFARVWKSLVENRFTVSGVSKSGRPYAIPIALVPDFEFFYAHRTILIPALIPQEFTKSFARTEFREDGDGKDNGKYHYA